MDLMGIDEGRVTCDLYGCHEELTVAPGMTTAQLAAEHPEWATFRGLIRCPSHPEGRPWLM
jgi:hypothetical protein